MGNVSLASTTEDTTAAQPGRSFEDTLPAEPWRRLWLRTASRGVLLLGAYFGLWELAEATLWTPALIDLHALHLVRGMGAALFLATWSFLQIRESRLESERAMHLQMDKLDARVRERTRELAVARSFTELLFDSLRERIVVLDESGKIIKANRVAEDVAGRPLLGERCVDVFPSCPCQRDCAGCVRESARGPVVEARADAQGRVWELETIHVPRSAAGEACVIGVGRDVTAQRSLEAQVRHQEKMASLGVMAAGFAHDIGNPLASISTELELLSGETDVKAYQDSLSVLQRHVGRMSATLREMVSFARRRRDEVTDVSVSAVFADSVRLVEHDPRWRGVKLEVDVPEGVPSVRMVEDHLVLVLVNLMLNAVDAMPEGGKLTLSAHETDSRVQLLVKDTGAGMTEAVLNQAFTPLFTTKMGRGTGLGLAVSHEVVKSVGGSLQIESTQGSGTTVTISLPRAEEPHG
jgi:signal transduction histidine kinase